MWLYQEKLDLFFYVKERIRFLLKSIKYVLCKVKKVIVSRKIGFVFLCKRKKRKKKKDILTKDPHSWDKFIIHASHKKKGKTSTQLSIPSSKFQTLQFCNKENFFLKEIKYVFNENTDWFLS